MSLRRRVAVELATLAVLTCVYLLVLPHRPMWLDASLGFLAVVLVAATARHTREQVWAPPATPRSGRLRHSWRHMLLATSAVALLFALIGGSTGRARPFVTATMPGARPSLVVAALNGLLFGAVHLPDVEVTVLTTVGGAVWSWYYVRDQCLGPIAMSHAVLGTTYYYWIRGDDLLLRWFSG